MEKSGAMFETIVESLKHCKKMIESVYDDNIEKTEQLDLLETYVKDFGQLETECDNIKYTLDRLDSNLSPDVTYNKIDSLFEDSLSNVPSSSAHTYKDTRVWKTVMGGESDVEEIHNKEKTLNESDYVQHGDSVLCSNVFAPPLDPISKVVIKNPYRHRVCGHAYEYDTIVNYVKTLKNKSRCPHIGCNTKLQMHDLVKDDDLQSQISVYLSQAQNSDEEED